MIAHDRHKLTLVNFSQYGQPQALVVRCLSVAGQRQVWGSSRESYDMSSE